MGKARIVSHLGDGLYNIEVLHARERIDAEIERLTDLIAELDVQLAALETERAEAVAARDLAQFELNEAVREYSIARDAAIAAGDPIPPPPDFTPLIVAAQQAAQQVQILDARIATIKARRLVLVKRKEALEAIPADQTQQAWCADLTETLSGEVGTAELPGEGVVGQFLSWRRIIIRPGHGGEAIYDAARDGQLFHRAGMSPEQAFFNAAILPGWQKWMPTYRVGTITSINGFANTCTLDLQSEDSSAQRLLIDPPSGSLTLSDVPIFYMGCNAAAFAVGDRVLVEFPGQTWQWPSVIGFEKEPKACELWALIPIFVRARLSQVLIVVDGSPIGDCSYPPLPGPIEEFTTTCMRSYVLTAAYNYIWLMQGVDDAAGKIASASKLTDLPITGRTELSAAAVNFYGNASLPTYTATTCSSGSGDPPTYPDKGKVPFTPVGESLAGFVHSISGSGNSIQYDWAVYQDENAGLFLHPTDGSAKTFASIVGLSEVETGSKTFTIEEIPNITWNGITYYPHEIARGIREPFKDLVDSGLQTVTTPQGSVTVGPTYRMSMHIAVRYLARPRD